MCVFIRCEESKKEDSAHQTSSSGTAGSLINTGFFSALSYTNAFLERNMHSLTCSISGYNR